MTEKWEEVESDKKFASCIDINAITQITSKVHRIRWAIENLSNISFDSKIPGPNFYLSSTCLASIFFQTQENHLFMYVRNRSDDEIQIVRKIFLFDCNDKKLHEETDSKIFRIEEGSEADILGSVSDRSRFDVLPNNTLIIDLLIGMEGEITTDIRCHQQFRDPKEKLIEDIKGMLENSMNSDISLEVGDERIAAHWSILCSRSPYFKKMFDSKMLERLQNTVTITDVSPTNFKKLIEFLYTAEFVDSDSDDLEELFGLYYAADKYEVLDMRALCGSKIISKSTTENICQIFQLAHRHGDEGLKRQAMDYLHLHSDAVFQTDGWKKFEESEPLAAEFFSFCLKKNKIY